MSVSVALEVCKKFLCVVICTITKSKGLPSFSTAHCKYVIYQPHTLLYIYILHMYSHRTTINLEKLKIFKT